MALTVKLSESQQRILGIAATLVAFMTILFSSGLYYWLSKRSLSIALRPNIDFLFISVVAIAWPLLKTKTVRIRRFLIGTATIILSFAILLGVAQSIAMREFGYHFTLAYHMSKVEALLKMMYDAQSLPFFIVCIALLVFSIALVMYGCARALRRLFRVAESDKRNQRNLAIGLGVYTAFAALLFGFNASITVEISEQIAEAVYREERIMARAASIEKRMKKVPKLHLGPDIKRPTILVFVVESYGQILLEAKKYEGWSKTLAGMQKSLTENGYFMQSRAYRAPVFGGSSWLANATILCRFMVSTEKTFISLFKTKTRCLPLPLNEAGYESVFAASNTTEIVPEYAARFPFKTFYPRDELGYKGPRISWSYMPDQYVIDVVERRILSVPSAKPRFVYYKLTSSHHPWDAIPPYIEDWDRIGDGTVYEDVEILRYPGNEFLGGKFYNEGYLSSIEYSMQTVVGYLNQMPKDREVLAIVLGDHQPRRPVADMDTDPWTVPLHVISRDKVLVDRFVHEGYTEGLPTKTADGVTPGLEQIASDLFRVLNDIENIPEASKPPSKPSN